MAQESTSTGIFVDGEFYCLSSKRVDDGIDTINCNSSDQVCGMLLTDDSEYAEELQLQEAIAASLIKIDSIQEEEEEGESSMMVTSTKEIGESSLIKNDSNPEDEKQGESSMITTTSAKEIDESSFIKNDSNQEDGHEGESSMMVTSTKEIGESSLIKNDSNPEDEKEGESSMITTTTAKEIDESSLIKNDSNQEDEQGGESSTMVTSTNETGESSHHHSVCEICVEEREIDEMVRIQNCSHSFCSDCVTKHVTVKVEEKNVRGKVLVRCPGLECVGSIELDTCKSLIPKEVFDRWNEAVVESMIEASQKFYCPFKDCSALLVNDSGEDGAVIRACECPECNRLFCAQCYVPWHSDIDCDELQRLSADEKGNEDRMVRQLAKEKSWMRCPSCKFYVEKTQGCLHMTCRCGIQFCYACGELWSETHGGCRP